MRQDAFRRRSIERNRGCCQTPPPDSNALTGEVIHIVFESEDASYSVVRVRDFQGREYMAVGSMPGVSVGQTVQMTGKWETHSDHGLQMRVESYSFSLPVTPEGIARYLASGIIKGIGEKTAKKIVDHFGPDTLKVLDSAPRRLMEIKGFTPKKIQTIREAWHENSDRRELRIFLEG